MSCAWLHHNQGYGSYHTSALTPAVTSHTSMRRGSGYMEPRPQQMVGAIPPHTVTGGQMPSLGVYSLDNLNLSRLDYCHPHCHCTGH